MGSNQGSGGRGFKRKSRAKIGNELINRRPVKDGTTEAKDTTSGDRDGLIEGVRGEGDRVQHPIP